MDVGLSGFMEMNLQSLQQTVSLSIVDKAMNLDAASMSIMLNGFEQANPMPAVDGVGANINVLA